jgi:hypothetical protein
LNSTRWANFTKQIIPNIENEREIKESDEEMKKGRMEESSLIYIIRSS